jgi:hypothetical protein
VLDFVVDMLRLGSARICLIGDLEQGKNVTSLLVMRIHEQRILAKTYIKWGILLA